MTHKVSKLIQAALDSYHYGRLTPESKVAVMNLIKQIQGFESLPIEDVSSSLDTAAFRTQLRVMDRFGEDHTSSFFDCYLPDYLDNYRERLI